MPNVDVSDRDRSILEAIRDIRAEYQACTAAAVAVRLHLSKPYVHELMHGMNQRGLITWNAEMPGSVRALVRLDGSPVRTRGDHAADPPSTQAQPVPAP